ASALRVAGSWVWAVAVPNSAMSVARARRIMVAPLRPVWSLLAGRGGARVVGPEVDAVAEDYVVVVARDYQLSDGSLVEGSEDRVVDHVVGAGYVDLELDDRSAAGRHYRGLNVAVDHRSTLDPDAVEDLADDVEAAGEVGAAVAYEHAHGLADLGLE